MFCNRRNVSCVSHSTWEPLLYIYICTFKSFSILSYVHVRGPDFTPIYFVSQNTHKDKRCYQLIHSNKTIYSLATHKMRKSTGSWIPILWTTCICKPSLFSQRGNRRVYVCSVSLLKTLISPGDAAGKSAQMTTSILWPSKEVFEPDILKSNILTHLCTHSPFSLLSKCKHWLGMSVPSPFSNTQRTSSWASSPPKDMQHLSYMSFLSPFSTMHQVHLWVAFLFCPKSNARRQMSTFLLSKFEFEIINTCSSTFSKRTRS